MIRHNGYEPKHKDEIPEFERVCGEGRPEWFLMENVPEAPVPARSFTRQVPAATQAYDNSGSLYTGVFSGGWK